MSQDSIVSLLRTMVSSIVDDVHGVVVEEVPSKNPGKLYQVKVSRDDVGKVIGKEGRIASALRTVAKAAGAKSGVRVMVNVFNKPAEE
jgi:predicted RNA-binding protein YlqC (UPF0109 family)